MDWYKAIFELIDMRSFSNLWFWIVLAVVWSSASHWVMGIPYDMITRARRVGGQPAEDLEAIARVYVNRLVYISDVSGLWLLGLTCFLISGLLMLGFVYGIEFAQAVVLLFCPMMMVAFLSLLTARHIAAEGLTGEDLCKRLLRHRLHTQMIGTVAIFVTALWGMYQNLTIGVLG
ncbi:MAG: component of SufBCD complex [Rhodobacteraceae bacterium]|nr:component of SufBCD complex [Paracoccaceae bacterium]